MGTSQSSTGPGKGSPLVPPWADDEPQSAPPPQPKPARFAPFRQSLGKYINSRNGSDLRSALKHYAKKGSGGGAIASRKLGSINQAGAGLVSFLTGNAPITVPGEGRFNINDLAGQSCETVISLITNALTSNDGDTDKIRSAMNHALIEALDGVEKFDPNTITDDVIVDTMINYLAESIFLQIVLDAGNAWNKAETMQQELSAENDLRELITVVVDKYLQPKLDSNLRAFSASEIIGIERLVINEIWTEWEAYQ